MDINLLYFNLSYSKIIMIISYLFYHLRRGGVVHTNQNQKKSVRLWEAHWFPQSPTIVVRITCGGVVLLVWCVSLLSLLVSESLARTSSRPAAAVLCTNYSSWQRLVRTHHQGGGSSSSATTTNHQWCGRVQRELSTPLVEKFWLLSYHTCWSSSLFRPHPPGGRPATVCMHDPSSSCCRRGPAANPPTTIRTRGSKFNINIILHLLSSATQRVPAAACCAQQPAAATAAGGAPVLKG